MTEAERRFAELWREVHALSQEKMLLTERLRRLQELLEEARRENDLLRKALHALRRHYLRSFVALASVLIVLVGGFFLYLDLRIKHVEELVTREMKAALNQEAQVGLALKELYPDLYRTILENTRLDR